MAALASTRRRTLVLALASVLAALAAAPPELAQASEQGTWTAARPTSRDLNTVAAPTIDQAWVAGAAGTLLASGDGGQTWRAQPSGTNAELHGLEFADAETGWAVGAGDTVLRTADGGTSWQGGTTGTSGALLRAVDFVSETNGWVAGGTPFPAVGNLVAATTDGGATWQRQTVPGGIGLLDVSFADASHGFVGGFAGAAYRTADGGQTWSPMTVTNDGVNITSVVRIDEQLGLAAAFRSVYRTTDGGTSWAQVAELDRPVAGLAYADGVAFGVGERGMAIRSIDGGASWELEAPGTSADLTAIDAPSAAFAVAAAAGGTVATYRIAALVPRPLDISADSERCTDLAEDTGGQRLAKRWSHDAAGYQVNAVRTDITGDGAAEVVVSGTEGVRALVPGRPTAEATLWERPFQAQPGGLILADVDADGRPEVVIAAAESSAARSGVAVLDARTGQTVWSRRLSGGASQIGAADVDGDGRDDLAVITAGHALQVLSGLDGTDVRPARALGAQPTHLQVGDVTGDGTPHAVVTLVDGRAVAVDLTSGALAWTYRVEEGRLEAVALADVTGDGALDALVGGRGTPVALTSQNYDRTTALGTRVGPMVAAVSGATGQRVWDWGTPRSGTDRIGAIRTGDLTDDGVPDVVAHVYGVSSGHLLAFDGRGASDSATSGGASLLWSEETTAGTGPQAPYRPSGLAVGDGDGDGAVDAYLSAWSGSLLGVSGGRVQPAGTRDPARAERLFEIGRRPPHPHVSLQEGPDGLELLSASGDHLVALRDPASGDVRWPYDAGGRSAIAVGAVGTGGEIGLAVGSDAGRVYGLDRRGALLEGGRDVFLPDRSAGVAAVDVTGDGRDEVVAASVRGRLAAVDPRTSTLLWEVDLGVGVAAVAAMDGRRVAVGAADGRVVALDAATGAVAWEHDAGSALTALAYASDRGLLAAGDAAGGVRLLDGSGALRGEGATGTGSVTALVPADLDGDGRQEFAAAAGAAFQGFSATGERLWSHPVSIGASFVAAGDLTGDGADEVVGTSMGGQAHAIDGRTGEARWTIYNGWPGPVAVADLDGHGRAVAMVTNPEPGDARGAVRTVDADGLVLSRCTPRKSPHLARVADLDGDGAEEVVIGMAAGDVYVYHGTPPPPPPPVATVLAFTDDSPRSAAHGETVTVRAALTDEHGAAVAGAPVTFTFASEADVARSWSATTDADGVASRTVELSDPPGDYLLGAAFAGDDDRLPSEDAVAFDLTRADSALTLEIHDRPGKRDLLARLTDARSGAPLAGREIELLVDGEPAGTATTDEVGEARFALRGRDKVGAHRYEARFAGDSHHLPSSGDAHS